MKSAHPIDEARLGIMLNELRLPIIKTLWPRFAETADREGWPAARFLAAIAEHELAERANRRIERHLAEAHLPPGKTLDSFAFEAVPMISKAQVMAMAAGDSWLAKGANVLMFGPPGGGKSHLAAAIGLALIENGWRVLFTRTTDLVQKLQVARRELQLEAAIAKLDKFDLLILDDLAYVMRCAQAVHPRVCGERHGGGWEGADVCGSSPRVRGTPATASCFGPPVRFIPACAGNAPSHNGEDRAEPVHPRVCGERVYVGRLSLSIVGSSPRVRGTPDHEANHLRDHRFIPACAGNAGVGTPSWTTMVVHPRVCGERMSCSTKA